TNADAVADVEFVFLALPHGHSAAITADLDPAQKVVDLGADHRLTDSSDWDHFYGPSASAEPWTYGLPELPGRAQLVASSTKVANPGCYATAIQLSAAPLLSNGLGKPTDIVVVAASGTSGAGRQASIATSATEVMGSMSAYKVGGTHQHIAEVRQELSAIAEQPVQLSFTPLLAPMPRGILSTTTVQVADSVTSEQLRNAFDAAYGDSPFVHLLPPGQWPTTAATGGTNCVHIQVALDESANRAVVVAAIDNLGKGAAGQAVQNANLMFGLEPDLGLATAAVAP
ncbi:MAG: N-acetyl-gamma-glutamyl-phosphate reductase, partial [Actinobacteria bacterium]|nr:N-acetyl-gamma-glutamyl-phosphate reductase [Actinomycetota bacterium]